MVTLNSWNVLVFGKQICAVVAGHQATEKVQNTEQLPQATFQEALVFWQISSDILYPLHHKEAQGACEAQDDHNQELPGQK